MTTPPIEPPTDSSSPRATPRAAWSRKDIQDAIGLFAVVVSLVFVGLQIRQSNLQARGAAYQAIGIATSQWHATIDDRTNRLLSEANYPEAIARWRLADWERYRRLTLSSLRLFETVLLQTDQGVLAADALDQLGYAMSAQRATPGFQCVWPDLRLAVGSRLMSLYDSTLRAEQFRCNVDIKALRDSTVLPVAKR